MLSVFLEGVFPVFAVALVGFVFGGKQWFGWEAAQSVNRYVLQFALPVLWFHLIATAPFETFDWSLTTTFLFAELVVYGLGYLAARRGFRRDQKESVLWGLSTAYANQLFFVLPIALQLYGSKAALPIVAISTVDVLVLMTGTMLVMEYLEGRSDGSPFRHTLGSIFKVPAMAGLGLGLIFNLAGVSLPKGVEFFSTFVGNSAAPVSLFALGAVLAMHGNRSRKGLPIAISALKLVVMPVLAWALVYQIANIDPSIAAVAMVLAAGPVGTTPFVFALQYKIPSEEIAMTILLSTVLSLITISLFAAYV